MICRLIPSLNPVISDLTITESQIFFGKNVSTFNNEGHQLRRVNIREEGAMNILEIIYLKTNDHIPSVGNFMVLIPKGKLREAIALQEKLIDVAQ
jgi:hypothetical protein